MLQRESHFMSEVQTQNAQQQEAMQAHQESLRAQVIRQQEEMQKLIQIQVTSQREEMRSLMQTQIIQQREEVELMERRLKDEIFSHIGLSAEATRPASSTLPVISSVESDVN